MLARLAFPISTHTYSHPKRCFWQQRRMFLLHSIPGLESSVSVLSVCLSAEVHSTEILSVDMLCSYVSIF